MKIDSHTIEKLEQLSMLKLSEDEKQSLIPELEKLVEMIDKLGELDTSQIQPLKNVNNHKQELRQDIANNSLSKTDALKNAKSKHQDFFLVPKVIS